MLDANGWGGWKAIASETVLRGMLGIRHVDSLPAPIRQLAPVRHLLRTRYDRLSYALDWRDAICADPRLDTDLCNILDLVSYRRALSRIADYALIIILHSATGDNMGMLRRTASRLQRRKGALVVFVGNEYNLLDQKIGFIRDTGAEFIGTQLPLASAEWLYTECTASRVLVMPHALNPALYQPVPGVARVTDVGFVGSRYPLFIGDDERGAILDFLAAHGAEYGLRCDIRLGNLPRNEWVRFLSGCRAVAGAEAGTYYLDRTGTLIPAVEHYCRAHPDATAADIDARFFRDRPIVMSGKAISSRHFEPVGTRTCQVLVEGHYNGILRADEHYIAVRRDLSNVADVAARVLDEDYRRAMVERTHAYVMAHHTYAHRVAALVEAVTQSEAGS